MQKLILIRGLPGSGKSTLAQQLKDCAHVEADMYFLNERGEYQFDREKSPLAHHWCQHRAQWLLSEGENVVVSNTFVRKWEAQPYLDMAAVFNIPIQIITCHGTFQNTHGVSESTIQRMRDNWEQF